MLSRSILRVAVATAIALTMSTPLATAQVNGANIDINAFKPAMDSRGFVTVNAAQVLGHNEISSACSPRIGETRSSSKTAPTSSPSKTWWFPRSSPPTDSSSVRSSSRSAPTCRLPS